MGIKVNLNLDGKQVFSLNGIVLQIAGRNILSSEIKERPGKQPC
jgi:hypothetical protein